MDTKDPSGTALQQTAQDLNHLLRLLPENTINVDPNGDLTLAIGLDDESRTFRVSSQVMRLVSPVWRTMLDRNNGYEESKLGSIPFPDDDALAFFIVLLAGHSKFQMIPDKIKFNQLVDLCVICDKYDCISVLRPWISNWLSEWKVNVTTAGYEEWLFIAWVVGDEEAFRITVDNFVRTCKTNDSKQCLSSSGNLLDDKLPLGLAESVHKARHLALTQSVEACHAMVVTFGYGGDLICGASQDKEKCDALVFGSLVKELQKLEIYPGDPEEIAARMHKQGVETLCSEISDMQSFTYPTMDRYDRYGSYSRSHDTCGFICSLRDNLKDVVSVQVDKVLQANRKHLEVQRQKLDPAILHLKHFRG